MLQEVFDRYNKNLLQLVLVGLIAAVILAIPGWVLSAMGIGVGFMSLMSLGAGISRSMLITAAPGALLGLLLAPLAQAGLLGAARDVIAGAPVAASSFFSHAARSYVSLLIYTLLAGLTWIACAVVNLIPVLGPVVFLAALVCLGAALFLFAPYAIVTEGLSARAAYGLAWECISKRFGDTALSGVIFFVCALVMTTLTSILAFIPVVASLAVNAFGLPLIYVFLSMRYVAIVRPHVMATGASPSPQ